uniref:Uncharacterized protein n=1 Tax=Arundo donax TaxID=35708 RepID=A0A0A9PPP7_ARUDO
MYTEILPLLFYRSCKFLVHRQRPQESSLHLLNIFLLDIFELRTHSEIIIISAAHIYVLIYLQNALEILAV